MTRGKAREDEVLEIPKENERQKLKRKARKGMRGPCEKEGERKGKENGKPQKANI